MTLQPGESFQIAVIRHFMGRGQLGPFMWSAVGTFWLVAKD